MASVRKVSSGEDVDGTLLVVGLAAFSDGRWHAWAIPSLIGAAVTFVALGFFTAQASWLLGHGGWEQLILLSPGSGSSRQGFVSCACTLRSHRR
jgi:hypothetical protein